MADVKRNKVLDALDAQDAMVGRVEEMDDAAKKEASDAARERYEDMITKVLEPLAEELCCAIRAGKRHVDLGVWSQPHQYEHKKLVPTFTTPEGKKPSCLEVLFRLAAEEWLMDIFCAALEAVIKREFSGPNGRIEFVRHNIAVLKILPSGRSPRREFLSFVWKIGEKQ